MFWVGQEWANTLCCHTLTWFLINSSSPSSPASPSLAPVPAPMTNLHKRLVGFQLICYHTIIELVGGDGDAPFLLWHHLNRIDTRWWWGILSLYHSLFFVEEHRRRFRPFHSILDRFHFIDILAARVTFFKIRGPLAAVSTQALLVGQFGRYFGWFWSWWWSC